MFNQGDRVLVCVSGGADSVALTHVLLALAPEYCLQLGIAHLNHGLRQEDAERDASFVTSLARQLALPFYTAKEDVIAYRRKYHLSLEEAARKIRYIFFSAVAEKYGFNKIAQGHHSDDNAELVLMFLLRGSGPLGLSGIPPVREGQIVRPLINLTRSELIDFISKKKLQYVCDTSNDDLTFLRNKIRHHLIPELKKSYNPNVIETLNRLVSIIRAEDRWLDDIIEPVFENCLSAREPAKICLSTTRLGKLVTPVKRRIIRKAIFAVKENLRRITYSHVEAVLRLIENGPTAGRLNLPNEISIWRNRDELAIIKGEINKFNGNYSFLQSDPVAYQYEIPTPGTISIAEADASITLSEMRLDEIPDIKNVPRQIAYLDMDRLQFPLVVRNFRPGDRFSPLGMTGNQKVKKYFINNKVPPSKRQKCPILLSRNKIIWIAGHRIDNSAKVSLQTRRILKAELSLA